MANKTLKGFLQEVFESIELEGFNIEDVPEMELPENVSEEFHNKFLTFAAAKNHPDIMGHFKGKYLSSLDLKIKKAVGEEKFAELKEQEPDSLKLFDLAVGTITEDLKNNSTSSDNKAFDNYKKQTIKEIEEYKLKIASLETQSEKAVKEERNQWLNKLQEAKINEILSGKKFNSNIPADDLKLLIRNKLNSSPYLINMDEDLNFRIFNRENPEAEAIKEGKNVSINDVLDELSLPYIAKNNEQQPTDEPTNKKVLTVDTKVASEVDGRFIQGHPDYGKI